MTRLAADRAWRDRRLAELAQARANGVTHERRGDQIFTVLHLPAAAAAPLS